MSLSRVTPESPFATAPLPVIGVYTCKPDGEIEAYNETAERLWGRRPVAGSDRWCGAWRTTRLDGQPIDPDESPVARLFRDPQGATPQEVRFEHRDGQSALVWMHPRLVRDAAGRVIRAVVTLTEASGTQPPPAATLPPIAGAMNEALESGEARELEHVAHGKTTLIRVVPAERCLEVFFNDITRLREVESDLRRTREQFHALISHAPPAIFIKDAAGRYTQANPTASHYLGKPEGVVGLTDHDLLPEELADHLRQNDLEVLACGQSVQREEQVGGLKFLATKFPLPDEHGQLTHVGGVAIDITERSEMERRLRESEERFRILTDHAPVGIFLSAANGDAIFVNRAWCRMAGMSAGDALGTGWTRALHPDDREQVLQGWDEAVDRHAASESQFRFLRPDGTVAWIQGSAQMLFDADGHHSGYIGSCIEVTERKEAELAIARLAEETERKRRLYEGILSTTPDLAYVFGLDHRFLYANEALLTMWGKTWQEAIGRNCLELGYEPWHAEMHDREIEEVIATKQPVRGEVPFRHGVLGRRIYDYILSPVLDAMGNVEMIAGVTRDVTERKQAEERAHFLSSLAEALAPLRDEKAIATRALELIGRRLAANRYALAEFFPRHDRVRVTAEWLRGDGHALAGDHVLSHFGGREWLERLSKGSMRVDDVATDPMTRNRLEAYRQFNIGSYATHAIRSDAEPLLVLLVTRDQPRHWTDDELMLLEQAATRIWPLVERARSEAALRDSRKQLKQVYDHVPALISYLDRNEVFKFANDRYHEWFGIVPGEMVGKSLRHLLSAEAYAQREPYIARVLQGEAVVFEGPTVHHRLGPRTLHLSYAPDFATDGSVQGFYVMALDTTERKQSQDQLERQALRLRLLWEAAGVILTAEEPDAMLQRLFDKFSAHLGVDTFFNFMADETTGDLKLFSCRGITEAQQAEIARLEFGQAVCGTVAARRAPIVATCIQSSDDPLVSLVKGYGIRAYACNPLIAGDALLGTLSFASRTRDHFDPDEIEFLETITHYVTGAYVRWQLLENLRTADRRKDEFLATLAHELRNPLAPVRTGLEVMKMAGGLQPPIERVRATMERQVDQLVTLVNDLIDVSRITRGKLKLRPVPADLAEIVNTAVEASLPLLREAGHEFTPVKPDAPVFVLADPHRIAQVISNLLNNAAKYTPRGKGKIRLEVIARDGEVDLRVSDNGAGIPAAMLDRIFDMFTQIDSPAADVGGLGIGLTLVRSLVEMHGGSVWAESAGPGQGSRFTVRLPIAATAPARGTTAPGRATRDTPGRERVLIVDDNVDAAETLALAVEMMGHEVRTAHDGKAALELGERFAPTFVLMDLGMPVMDGWEAARQMRLRPWSGAATLVALTGWGQESDRRRTKESGFDRHLVKPASPDAIRDLLGRATAE